MLSEEVEELRCHLGFDELKEKHGSMVSFLVRVDESGIYGSEEECYARHTFSNFTNMATADLKEDWREAQLLEGCDNWDYRKWAHQNAPAREAPAFEMWGGFNQEAKELDEQKRRELEEQKRKELEEQKRRELEEQKRRELEEQAREPEKNTQGFFARIFSRLRP